MGRFLKISVITALFSLSILAGCNMDNQGMNEPEGVDYDLDPVAFGPGDDAGNENITPNNVPRNNRFNLTVDPYQNRDAVPDTQPKPDKVTPPPSPNQEKIPDRAGQEETTEGLTEIQLQVIKLTNQQREKNGLAPLKSDVQLAQVAQTKSEDMSANKYFSHTSPTYGSPFDMLKQFGVSYRTAAENIAAGQRSADEVVNAWMNSPGHRKNILNQDITHIGVGHAVNGNYWTQMFIKK